MEEILYTIKINKEKDKYSGKTYSDLNGEKSFENKNLGELLRDMVNDVQFNLDEETNLKHYNFDSNTESEEAPVV